MIELAGPSGIPWAERSLGAFDLYTAEECFLTGTGAELIPVRKLDGRALKACPGPVFRQLHAAFCRLVERESSPARVA